MYEHKLGKTQKVKVHESCSEERNSLPLARKPQKSRDESNLQMMEEEEEAMDDILSCS